jgi:tetratricopeptide (TPR) repeat protein
VTSSGSSLDQLAELEEQRNFLLRSLDDLDAEHGAGEIDEDEYRVLRDDYTARAAVVLRSIEDGHAQLPPSDPQARRRNATILAGVLFVGALVGFAVSQFAGQRAPGQTITGEADQSVRTRLVLAEQTFASGDVEGARTAVDDVLRDDARLTGALLLSARLHVQESEVLAALQELDRVLRDDPSNVEALTLRGWTLVNIDDPDLVREGIEALDAALAQDPETFDPYLFRGSVARYVEADLLSAIDLYNAALENGPPPAMQAVIAEQIDEMQAELDAAG